MDPQTWLQVAEMKSVAIMRRLFLPVVKMLLKY